MIPEGLQYQSIASTVSKIKSLGMNFIRLTYAISMIDDVVDGGGDVTLENSFNKALGSTNGPKVLAQVLAKNPTFTKSTTRLQVSLLVGDRDRGVDENRSLMLSRPKLLSSRFMSCWIIICRKLPGAVVPRMVMLGSAILISILRSGSADWFIWQTM